jgi:lysophospholipase L1-like esterase
LKYPFIRAASAYNVTPTSLARIRGKMARAYAGIDRADICVVGTSLSAGTGSQSGKGKSWPAQFAGILKDRGYSIASGFIPGQSNLTGGTIDSRVTLTSGWTALSGNTTRSPIIQGITPSNTATFADNMASTQIDIWYEDWFSFTWTYAVDGGSAVTVTNTNTGTRKKISITGMASANHTVVITPGASTTSGNPLYIIGVTFKNATGVAVHNIGIGGASVSGGTLGSQVHDSINVALAHSPQLTFIELGTNEPTPLAASFQTTMQTAITNLLAAGSDVVLIGESPEGTGTRPVAAVLAVDYTLADANNLAMVDLSDRLISWTSANTQALTYTTDGLTVHFNEAGYAEFARVIANALQL